MRKLSELACSTLPHIQSTIVASFLVWGGGGGKTPKCTDRKKCNLYARASASETYIFRSPNTSAHHYNQCSSLYITYGMVLCRQYNDKMLTLSMRASLANFSIFTF